MWTEANERIELVSAKDLAEEIASGEILLLDVRLPVEIERRGTIAIQMSAPRWFQQYVVPWVDDYNSQFATRSISTWPTSN